MTLHGQVFAFDPERQIGQAQLALRLHVHAQRHLFLVLELHGLTGID